MTNNPTPEKIATTSADIVAERIAQLGVLFPEACTEGRVDFDKLRAALGDLSDERPERYSFSWAGKRDSIRLLQTPSRATLKPAPDEAVNFDDSQHVFIEGDNLEVLKLLHKSYFGRVKMIYIDPPYNTGNDFVYPDNFKDPLETYLQLSGQKDANGNLLTSNAESGGRYHSAWLSMMYPRLFLARQLLRDDGVIFISIDDHEVHNLRIVMNEIFGEENFLSMLCRRVKSGGGSAAHHFAVEHDYVVVFARNKAATQPLFIPYDEEYAKRYSESDEHGRFYWDTMERSYTQTTPYKIKAPDGTTLEGKWFRSKERFQQDLKAGEVRFLKKNDDNWSVQFKQRMAEGRKVRSLMNENEYKSSQDNLEAIGLESVFSFPKPVHLLKVLTQAATTKDSNDIVLDFFAGSGTTAQAVLELNREDGGNRQFICVQLPEPTGGAEYSTIADISRERIRRVTAKMQAAQNGTLDVSTRETPEDLGFKAFKLSSSNFRQWQDLPPETDAEEYARQMELFNDPLLENWTPHDVLYEVALKEGYSLTSRIEAVAPDEDGEIWRVTDDDKKQHFHICLSDNVSLERVQALCLGKDDVFICRGAALDDTVAANLALQCRLKTL